MLFKNKIIEISDDLKSKSSQSLAKSTLTIGYYLVILLLNYNVARGGQ